MSQEPRPFDATAFLLRLLAGVIIFRLLGLAMVGGICASWYANRPNDPLSATCAEVSSRADNVMSSTIEIALALLGGGGAAAASIAMTMRRPPEDPPSRPPGA